MDVDPIYLCECGEVATFNSVKHAMECSHCGLVWDPLYHKPHQAEDVVNHPKHYCGHPSGIECIQITEHMNFCLGNAVKYIWRSGHKGSTIEDLKKARYYISREIDRLEGNGHA